MGDFDLRFKSPLVTTHPVDLRFNSGDDAVTENTATLAATIDAPTLNALALELRRAVLSAAIEAPSLDAVVYRVVDAAMVATIDTPTLESRFGFDNAVYRGAGLVTSNAWGDASTLDAYRSDQSETPKSINSYVTSTTSDALSTTKSSDFMLDTAIPKKQHVDSSWNVASSVLASAASSNKTFASSKRYRDSIWQTAVAVQKTSFNSHFELLRKPRTESTAAWSLAIVRQRGSSDPFAVALRSLSQKGNSWTETKRPDYGIYVRPVDPTIPDGYKPPVGNAVVLLFKEKATTDTDILFGIRQYVPSKKVIPIRRAYAVINTTDLRLVETNQRIETFSMDMSIDMDSWTWGFSANVAARELPKLLPSAPGIPVLVDALVNGEHFKFLVESTRRSRSFGKDAISISGRGMSATLADPYSPTTSFTNTQARTAQQLMNDALTNNGVPIGWTVDWQIDDWLVPTGVWSHQGNYMSAITTIAASVGAFVQPDPANKVLRIKSRNKVKPWDLHLSEADIEIPSAVIETESVAWEDRAKYDSVYVSGTTDDGVLGLVRRSGTAGDKPAPMVTDALITNAIAARQRGIFELSRFGSIVKRDLNLPVLNESGIIMPGAIVKYTDGGISTTGVVNGVRVNVASPSVRQQISITSYE